MNVREPRNAMAGVVAWEFAQSTYAPVLADVPPTLFSYWAGTAHHEFPAIPRDASFYAQATEGLMMFFDCVAAAGRMCGLPSRAADSVWHAWTRMDAPSLERFCVKHFGRPIPHVGKARMKEDMGRALAACLVQGRRRTGRAVGGASLPKLFSLDAQLGMPYGFGYRMIGGLVACSDLDEFGNPTGAVTFPASLSPKALHFSGLISQAEYEQAAYPGRVHEPRSAAANRSSNGVDQCIGLDGDGASGDSDGASACGGECGGGGACGS